MEELVIRPTTKFIKIAYAVVIVLLLAAVIAQSQFKDSLPPRLPSWVIPGVFAMLLLWPASRHWAQRFTKMTMVVTSCATRSACYRRQPGQFSSRKCRT